ncbi:chaplin [Streptomyces sp. NPDC047108]|uniref:chaplin n=1 Tax=Streptomyces sp. NPDC047108 TaxID=3155025 RepID=UPI0033D9BF89
MKQVAKKGLVTVMATGGVLAAAAGYAHADSGAVGAAAGSPGVLSGNTVQVPVDVPVNVCGNTVNVVGLLNRASGNECTNGSGGEEPGGSYGQGSHRAKPAGATQARAEGSPGIASGNTVRVPVDVPVNITGNSANVVGVGNSAESNTSSNTPGEERPEAPRTPVPPKADTPAPPRSVAHSGETNTEAALAHTGADVTGFALPAAAGLVLGGAVLYRRTRAARR